MQAEEFRSSVKELAEVETNEEADRAIRATLETLRERLAGNEPSNLADQLPGEFADYLRGQGGQDNFSLQEFYQRVAEKEGVEEMDGTRHARAVATTIQAAVDTNGMDHVRTQLKDDYKELFGQPGAAG